MVIKNILLNLPMPITNLSLFESANDRLRENLALSLSEFGSPVSDSLFRLEIIGELTEIFKDFDCCLVLNEVYYDLFTSIYLAMSGLYRNSFISLRSASELGLGFFYFFDYNYHYQKWKSNSYNLSWTILTEEENGVLSKKYLTLNHPNIKIDDFIADYKNLYSYCSEYVHGKYQYMHMFDSTKIEFNKNDLQNFFSKFTELTTFIFSLFILRFILYLPRLSEEKYIYVQEYSKQYSLSNLLPEYGK